MNTEIVSSSERHRLEARERELTARLLDLVTVLDERRHNAVDWRWQLKKHGLKLALIAGGLLGAALLVRRLR